MPKWSDLPPRDLSGWFLKRAPSPPIQPPKTPDRKPEPSPSGSTLPDSSFQSVISDTSSAFRSPLVFPKPVHHSIPGSFSPVSESPLKISVPTSALISWITLSLSLSSPTPRPVTRTPSPVSLPQTPVLPRSPSASPSFPSDHSLFLRLLHLPRLLLKLFPSHL